jgi:replicative DNA helicase
MRRLVEVGTRIAQLGYAGDGDADELVDQAQAEVYAVTDRRVSEDYLPLSEIMPGALDEIEAIGSRGGGMTGVPTGFADLDALTNGLHPGQMIVIAARPALGKALALDTPLPTPTGWTSMGEVQVGDYLIGADGKPTRVLAATDVMHERPCFEVEFDDGTVIVADAEHQWRTTTRAAELREPDRCVTGAEVLAAVGPEFRNVMHTAGRTVGLAGARVPVADRPKNAVTTAAHPDIKTTAQIAATLRSSADGRLNHGVAVARSAELPAKDLPFPPYALGAWLVDATSRADHGSATAVLRKLGVLGNKHIPTAYLRAAETQRRALLAGLLDADGDVATNGTVQFAVTNRRLAADTLELVLSLGYRAKVTTKPVKGATEESSTCYMVTFTPADRVFRLTRKLARQTVRAQLPTRYRFITDVRPLPSVPVRCVQVDNAEQMYLAGRSWIPTHNSTLALDLARAASIRHHMATVIFSLEMSRNEITMRLLSAEARVPLHTMRTGQLSDDDWTRLARRMSEVADAPLFIDDSPNMSLMEIRSKCRRLKQRNDLRMVIIDYLQLMSSPRRVENRQQEVSEMSRSLKLLAKELEVPVIAVSQLNRGPEQRTDKRPMLSDLRESGCLTADTKLLRADTGAPVTFGELVERGHEGVLVWSVDQHRRLVPSPITNVFPSGVKNVYRLRLASGREVKASGNHPFLTFGGWTPLEELTIGDRLGIPRRIPEPIGAGLGWSEHRLGLLAHLIGDGCVLRKQPVHYTSADEANLAFVEAAAAAEFGITARRVAQATWFHTYLPAPYRCARGRLNPLHTWFIELGISDLRSYQKRIPAALHSASNREVAVFLRHLWATDGNVTVPRTKTAPKVYYASSSRELADGVALLLARFGIVARIRQVTKPGYRPGFHVIVADGPSLLTFCREIGVHGARGEFVREMVTFLDGRAVNTNADTLPIEVWNLVKSERSRVGMTERQLQAAIGTHYCGTTLYKSCPSRERLLRCADALDSTVLRQAASSDIYWDRIVATEALGPQPVYDATVKETHNFIADGILVHNSIEQDSDMVILLHREDAYERESPRAGEADLVVAKHRNGPTATVTVAFQGHYSRFVDMAPG